MTSDGCPLKTFLKKKQNSAILVFSKVLLQHRIFLKKKTEMNNAVSAAILMQ